MARRKARTKRKSGLTVFLIASFFLGLVLGSVIASIWLEEPHALQLAEGESYASSIVIVGVEKETGQGKLATLTVELKAGQGRLLINPPPYENEDTQKSFLDAMSAAEHETGCSLEQSDVIVSIENLPEETTIAGPSASAAMAVALVATIRASENDESSEVRQDAVVSATIDSLGMPRPVGEVSTKYQAVRADGSFSFFVVDSNQTGNLPDYSDIQVKRVSNFSELVDWMLIDHEGGTSSSHVEVQPVGAAT